MQIQKFEELVLQAIGKLPEEFRSKLENVDVVVEEWPSRQQLNRSRLRYRTQLLGLYEGIPQTSRGVYYNLALPDKITIFQKPIEARCHDERDIAAEIGRVVRHEIAHHFGLSDEALRRIEKQQHK